MANERDQSLDGCSKVIRPKDLKALLIAVNASKCVDKYPFGNIELTKTLKNLEHARRVQYDVYTSTWVRL